MNPDNALTFYPVICNLSFLSTLTRFISFQYPTQRHHSALPCDLCCDCRSFMHHPVLNTIKVNFTPEQATKTHTGGRSITTLFLISALYGGGWSMIGPAALPPERTLYVIGGVGLRACLTDVENLAFTGIRSPKRPARSESLYRLRYPDALATILYIFTHIHIQGHYFLLPTPPFEIAVHLKLFIYKY